MNKILLLAGVISVFAFNANATEVKPYIALDYVHSIADIDKVEGIKLFEDNFNGAAVALGVNVNRYVSTEIFYQQVAKEDKKFVNAKTEDKYKAYGIDVIGHLPVADQFDLLGSVGVAEYKVDYKASAYSPAVSLKKDDNGLGARLGIGAEYNVTDNWAVRAMARYSWVDVDGVDGITELSVGVKYTF